MKKFFLTILATTIGSILAACFVIILGIGLVMYITSGGSGGKKPQIVSNSVLKINLEGNLDEYIPQVALALKNLKDKKEIDLLAVKTALEAAQNDDRIKGVYLDVKNLQGGWVLLSELRESLKKFKQSGKFVVAYGQYYNSKTYYIASLADEIFLHPEGDFDFRGLSVIATFYKGLFDKLEVTPQIFRVGRYKSAVEPFLHTTMSEANKYQLNLLLNTIYEQFLEHIASDRNLTVQNLRNLADNFSISNPQEAKNQHLITHLGYLDQFEDELKKKLTIEKDEKINYVDYYPYANLQKKDLPKTANKIAILFANGTIVNTSQVDGQAEIVSNKFIENLKKLKEDTHVKAIVIRINSPGGSALASNTIWNEIIQTKAVKPVVASLADKAASGGYYMAVGCDYIIAHPTTITGSIGIFAVYFDIHQALKNKLGITFDTVKTGTSADLYSFSRPVTDHEKKVLQRNIEHLYGTFVENVAVNRHKKIDQIHDLAQGRVWPGNEAKHHGLVDELGDLDAAIKKAASLANVQEYKISYTCGYRNSFIEELMNNQDHLKINLATYPFLETYRKILEPLKNMHGIQARWDYNIEIG